MDVLVVVPIKDLQVAEIECSFISDCLRAAPERFNAVQSILVGTTIGTVGVMLGLPTMQTLQFTMIACAMRNHNLNYM